MSYDLTVSELLEDRIIRFDPVKSRKLELQRGVSFEHISAIMSKGQILSIQRHSSAAYAHQYMCEINIEGYIYIVPMVVAPGEIFLKTAYPSRKATGKYRKGGIT